MSGKGELSSEEATFLDDFVSQLKVGIKFEKLTQKASVPVKRVLCCNAGVSQVFYRRPHTVEEGLEGFCVPQPTGTSIKLSVPMLSKPKGTAFANKLFRVKVKSQTNMIKILCRTEEEYNYMMKGFTLLYNEYSLKETVGQGDDRNRSVDSIADLRKVAGYVPASYTYIAKDGSKKTYNLLFGYSWEDMGYFLFLYPAVWFFVFGFFGLLLKANLDTDEEQVALWYYFYFFVLCVIMLGLSIFVSQKKAAEKKAAEEEAEAKAQEA